MNVKKETCAFLPDSLQYLVPFHHDIDLGNGINTAPQSRRIRNAVELFFPGLLRLCGGNLRDRRILDLGCNCGGFSFAAARYKPDFVLGIDSRQEHIKQANAIRDYLGLRQCKFICANVEDVSPEEIGRFEVCICAGIIYHLQNPIGVMRKLSQMVTEIMMVDSHVHYSGDATREDMPLWWMLHDTDLGSVDGVYVGHEVLNVENLRRFEKENPVDYSVMPGQFVGSPHSVWEQMFVMEYNPDPPRTTPVPEGVCATEVGSLVMVPNRKALFNLMRHVGFEDILEVVPHRFSEVRYLRKYRVGFFAMKRREGGPFPLSETQRYVSSI